MAEYHVENFGCRASQADGAAISAQLMRLGLREAASVAAADVLVLNTCSVTEEADRQARAYVRKAHRANPKIQVVVTGCYAQRAPADVAALPGVDRVVGNSHKQFVAETAAALAGVLPPAREAGGRQENAQIVSLQSLLQSGTPLVDDHFAHSELAYAGIPGESTGHTRPNLKVQDGCGNRCSFCVIPQTRGGSRSVAPSSILASVRAFAAEGGQEMVLSGINLGRWGRDLAAARELSPANGSAMPDRIEGLVESILTQTNLPRLRMSSVEPMDWSERLMDLFRSFAVGTHPRLARHAHLPLQSGSDAILRAMYRRYRPWHYAEKVDALRTAMPDAAIGADVMVGFPGETEAHFRETYRFLESLPFTYLHLFPFSARPGTPAWTLHREKPVPGEAVLERMAHLRALGEAKHRAFREQLVGRQLSVITLHGSGQESNETRSISDNFINVQVEGSWSPNQLLSVFIDGLSGAGLRSRDAQAEPAV